MSKMRQFAVIGLGSFGIAVAKHLVSLGKEVLVVDKDKDRVEAIADEVTKGAIADANDPEVWNELGVRNFDCAINCLGNAFEASVMVTLLLKEAGVPYVVARAVNARHRDVLNKIGADLVVFPDEDMGFKLAARLSSDLLHDSMDIDGDYRILELELPDSWEGKDLLHLDARKRYGVTVLMIRRADGSVIVSPGGNDVMNDGDSVLVFGKKDSLDLLVKRHA